MKKSSQLADMVHNEVAAARIELDNQSTQIQDRLSELHYRMEELLSNQSPENDGLAFESAMAITTTSDVDVRSALQWHLAEVSRSNFQQDAEAKNIEGKNNRLSRADIEQKMDDTLSRLNLSERRLEDIELTTAAEHSVTLADLRDFRTMIETTPLATTAERGVGVYVPSTELKSVAGLRPRSRDFVGNLRTELTKLHQLILTKTAAMASDHIRLEMENEGMRHEVEALRAAIARPVTVTNVEVKSPSDRSNGNDAGSAYKFNAATNEVNLEDPLLTFAMDNIMRVLILARIPPLVANKVYEQLLEFANDWTQTEFLTCCESADNFAEAIIRTGLYTLTEPIQSALRQDMFFANFRRKQSTGNRANNTPTKPSLLTISQSPMPTQPPQPQQPPALAPALAPEMLTPSSIVLSNSNVQSSIDNDDKKSEPANNNNMEAKKNLFAKNVLNVDTTSSATTTGDTPANKLSNRNRSRETKKGQSSGKKDKRKSKKERRGRKKSKIGKPGSTPRMGVSASMISRVPSDSNELVLSTVAKNMSEVQLGSVVHVQLSTWKVAHRASVIKVWDNGSVDVELSNGRVAESLGPSALRFTTQ